MSLENINKMLRESQDDSDFLKLQKEEIKNSIHKLEKEDAALTKLHFFAKQNQYLKIMNEWKYFFNLIMDEEKRFVYFDGFKIRLLKFKEITSSYYKEAYILNYLRINEKNPDNDKQLELSTDLNFYKPEIKDYYFEHNNIERVKEFSIQMSKAFGIRSSIDGNTYIIHSLISFDILIEYMKKYKIFHIFESLELKLLNN